MCQQENTANPPPASIAPRPPRCRRTSPQCLLRAASHTTGTYPGRDAAVMPSFAGTLPLCLKAEAFKLFVDHRLESFQRLRTTQKPTVDKERWSPRDPGFDPGRIVALDLLLVLALIHAGLKS